MKLFIPILAALLLTACAKRDNDVKAYFEKHQSAFDSLATQLPGYYADTIYRELTITPGDIQNPALQKAIQGLDVFNISMVESLCDKQNNYDKLYFQMKVNISAYYIYSACKPDTSEHNVKPLNGNWYYVLNSR